MQTAVHDTLISALKNGDAGAYQEFVHAIMHREPEVQNLLVKLFWDPLILHCGRFGVYLEYGVITEERVSFRYQFSRLPHQDAENIVNDVLHKPWE